MATTDKLATGQVPEAFSRIAHTCMSYELQTARNQYPLTTDHHSLCKRQTHTLHPGLSDRPYQHKLSTILYGLGIMPTASSIEFDKHQSACLLPPASFQEALSSHSNYSLAKNITSLLQVVFQIISNLSSGISVFFGRGGRQGGNHKPDA